MATQNAANQQFANNADGFTLGGGTTVRSLTVTSGSPTITGGSNTLTLAGNLTTSGAYALTLTLTGTTNVTLPTSGTLEPVVKAYVTKTGNYTMTASDVVVLANASGGGFTLTLPTAASGAGNRYYIKKIDTTGNVVTIGRNGASIDGVAADQTIGVPYQCLMLISDGSAWYII